MVHRNLDSGSHQLVLDKKVHIKIIIQLNEFHMVALIKYFSKKIDRFFYKTLLTSVSKKLGQSTVVYCYCALSQFF